MLCRGKRIKRRTDDHNLLLLSLTYDFLRYGGILAHNHTACFHICRTLLRILSVAHDNQIIPADKIRHQDPAGCRNHNFSLQEIAVLIPGHDFTVHCTRDIPVLSTRLCQNLAVIYIHVCLRNITDRDNTLKFPVPRHGKSMYIGLAHFLPCSPDRDTAL